MAELRRLHGIRSEFSSDEEYVAHVREVLRTLEHYDIIHDSNVQVSEFRIDISMQIKTVCLKTLHIDVKR